jgi:pyridoxal phosphate enzyme (YggS family)
MELIENYVTVRKTIPDNVSLVAVSKYTPESTIRLLHELAGHTVFGENRAQELAQKAPNLPQEIQWHFIGHLQTNKVRFILPYVRLIQSVDSFRLLKVIDREARQIDKVIKVLLQFHIATEETKFGLSVDEAFQMLENKEFAMLDHIDISGVMGMASFTDNQALVRREFAGLRMCFEELKSSYFTSADSFKEISMGMSNDYQLAIEEGSTMVRIGSLIFGDR